MRNLVSYRVYIFDDYCIYNKTFKVVFMAAIVQGGFSLISPLFNNLPVKKDFCDIGLGLMVPLRFYVRAIFITNQIQYMSEFVWTEESVRELLNYYTFTKSGHRDWTEEIEDFKASKQPKPEWEIMEGDSGIHIHTWVEKGDPHSENPCLWQSCHENKCKIHSVKRLSDGEVFTVGDEVISADHNKIRPITHFDPDEDGQMRVYFNEYGRLLRLIERPPLAIPVLLTPVQIEKLNKLLNEH